jgi:hypothetical protein
MTDIAAGCSAIAREALVQACFFLPERRRIRLERWLRGRQEWHKFASADTLIVSYGNSGRTWLRVLLSRFFQAKYALNDFSVIDFDNLHDRNTNIPSILFTHDNYLNDYTGNGGSKTDYKGKKLILLVRDPADVAVSQYYQWRHRMRESKKLINAYPRNQALDVFEFVSRADCGLPKIVAFMNGWAKALPELPEALVIRYEDLRTHTELTLERVLATLGQSAQPEELRDAVEFASIERMRELEAQGIALISMPPLLRPWTRRADGYKARRGKVGGYRDILTPEQVEWVDDYVIFELSPAFGYHRGMQAERPARVRS